MRRLEVVSEGSPKRIPRSGLVHWRSFTEQYLDSCGIFKDAVLGILATIAKQERVGLFERTLAGLARARKQGRVGGRPKAIFDRARVERWHKAGKSLADIAEEVGVSKSSVHRITQPL